MKLREFLTLPDEFTIDSRNGDELHEDISINGIPDLDKESTSKLIDYLERCLAFGQVSSKNIIGVERELLKIKSKV